MTVVLGIVAKKLIIFGAFLLLSSLFTATGEEIYSLSQLNYNLKKLKKEKIFVKYQKQNKQATQPTDRKEGWSEWQTWDNFPHERIQLGVSNTDYGGLMDMEYKCFGKVSRDNNLKKSQTYWYRIADRTEGSEYVKIEVGCFIDGEFKAISIINGLIKNAANSGSSELVMLNQQLMQREQG